ncbi:LacI family DNA-binding transcriptional regulator [Blautia sp. RD014234]|nr:LacI family DNA-binding transcriptional regulator [Blautia parvula]
MPSRNTEKPITRKDIAELLGVSVSVVSRALNNSGYVEEKRDRRS